MEHVRVGVGRQPPEDRRGQEARGFERDRHGGEARHRQQQEPGDERDPAHARQELDEGDGSRDRARREDRLEQVQPEGGVVEREQVAGDEAQDHVCRIARRMGRAEHPGYRLELGRVPAARALEHARSQRRQDQPESRRGRDEWRECRARKLAAAARLPEPACDRPGAIPPWCRCRRRRSLRRRSLRRGERLRPRRRARCAVPGRQFATSQASLPRRFPTG